MHSITTIATYTGLGTLLLWRLYSRLRRMISRQRLSKYRAHITLVVFPLLMVLVAAPSFSHPARLGWLLLALTGGAALGFLGLRHTRFEVVGNQQLYYTPNAHIGIALFLLFIARLAYRYYEVFSLDPAALRASGGFAQSPLTFVVFGLLGGYYIIYAAGLVRWRARVIRAENAQTAETDNG